jgi:hypothetical protein
MRRFTLLLLGAPLGGTDRGAAQETVEARGVTSVVKVEEVNFGHLHELNGKILQRLGFLQPGKMLGDQLGWPEAWVPEPDRRLFFIIDLRDRRRPCAVLLVCDPGRQAHQLFALKRIKGRFGRQEYQFICPHTGRQSTAISPIQRASFSVRRNPFHQSKRSMTIPSLPNSDRRSSFTEPRFSGLFLCPSQSLSCGLIQGWRMPDKPEQKARREIDADLKAAGWIVQNLEDLEVTAGRGIAVRILPLRPASSTLGLVGGLIWGTKPCALPARRSMGAPIMVWLEV